MEQVLIRSGSFDFASANHEDSGLVQLQLWSSDKGDSLALFEVSNRAKAEGWIKTQSGLGQALSAEFLRTK